MSLVQVVIDESTDKTITGLYDFDRDNGGTLICPSGASFPGSPIAKEWFWRTDEKKLYRRNNGNSAWDAIEAAVSAHALGGSDHTADTLANLNSKVSDATLDDSGDPRDPNAHGSSAHSGTIGTASQVGLGSVTNDAQLKRSANDFSTFTEKGTPVDADLLLIEDSAASGVKKKVQITNLPGGGGFDPAQTVIVAKSGGDYTSVKAAIDSITDATSSKPYAVVVYPGIYAEDPITLKQYVAVGGVGRGGAVVVSANNNNSPLFTLDTQTGVENLSITGPTNDAGVEAPAGKYNCGVENVQFFSGLVAIKATGTNAQITVEECKTFTNVDTGILAENGGRIDCSNVLQYADIAFHADGGTVWVHNSGASGGTTGLYADDGGVIYPHTCTLEDMTYGVRVGSTGTGSVIQGGGVACRGTTTYDIYVQSATGEVALEGLWREDLVELVTGAVLRGNYYDPDSATVEGQKIAGALSVGRPEDPHDSNIGGGGTYTKDMVVITSNGTATSTTDGGNLTDVSTAAASPDSSTFSFQGTTANHTILVGTERADASDVLKVASLRLIQTTAAVEITAKSFALEYWTGTSWVEIMVMAVSVEDLYRYANYVFIRANSEEDIFYDIAAKYNDWEKKTISGKNLFWLRWRITNALTTAPVFEQLQLGPSRTRTTGKGVQAYYGEARFKKTLMAGGNIFGESGGVGIGSVAVGSGAVPYGWDHKIPNSHMNSEGDALYFQTPLPRGVCTACPLKVRVIYTVDTGTSSVGELYISVLPVERLLNWVANPNGNKVPIDRDTGDTEVLTSKAAQVSLVTTLLEPGNQFYTAESAQIDVSDYYEGDMLLLRIELEDDGGGNKDLDVWSVEIDGVYWTPGERYRWWGA